jgi:ABC-type ATPase involved in cell division
MISLQRVTKTYKNGVTALTDVTVEVEKGEFVFIVGQSGSGKSTMIRLLLKEEEATEGDIYVGGKLNNYPDELSGGEQQRVSIARACVNRPLVLLADEPTGNLDPNTSVDIMRLLDKVNRIGTTVVMATHDQAIVDAMRKRVIELDKGHVIRDQSRGVYS